MSSMVSSQQDGIARVGQRILRGLALAVAAWERGRDGNIAAFGIALENHVVAGLFHVPSLSCPLTSGHGRRVVGHATILAIVSSPTFFTADVCEFVLQARQYCDFVAKCSALPLTGRLAAARIRLLELYRAGAALPSVEPPAGIEAGQSPDSPKGWAAFERFDVYWEVFDRYEEDEPVTGSLSDDILDVYKDVRRGLTLWDKDVPRSAALWEWRFHFDSHWEITPWTHYERFTARALRPNDTISHLHPARCMERWIV